MVADNWNQFDSYGTDPSFDGTVAYNLVDDSGTTLAGATVTYNAGYRWMNTNNVDSYDPGTGNVANGLVGTDKNQIRLMNGELGYGSGGSGTLAAVTGIPYATYDVIVYTGANDAGSGSRTGAVTIGGTTKYYLNQNSADLELDLINAVNPWIEATATDSGSAAVGNYMVFSGLSGATLNIDYEAVSGNTGISGFQIVDTTIPEPASATLLAAGSYLMLRRRRA